MKKLLFIFPLLLSLLVTFLIFSCGSLSKSKNKNNYAKVKEDYYIIIEKAKKDSINIILVAERRARNIILEAKSKSTNIINEAEKSSSNIKKEVLINKLKEKVKKIPVSKYKENLDIYRQLLELDPESEIYKKKVAFYEAKFELQKRGEKLKQSVKISAQHIGEYVIIAPPPPRVLSSPDGGNFLGRIDHGKKVEILEKKEMRSGSLIATWYKIKYKGGYGWISQYVTTGEIIKESLSGKTSTEKAPHSDYPKIAKFDNKSKENFKEWVSENTAVIWIDFPSDDDGIIWVKLSPEKYTSKDNVESIAKNLARVYRLQTNYRNPITVTVWDLYDDKIWAKGRLGY